VRGEEEGRDRRAPPVSAREGSREGRARRVGLGRAAGGPCAGEKGEKGEREGRPWAGPQGEKREGQKERKMGRPK
jgi:hypothetical protein